MASKSDPVSVVATTGNTSGNTPEVSLDLSVENRTITDANQAYEVCQSLQTDWQKGITNAARITSKINGERPYNQRKLENAGKGWKTNISTGFLASECRQVAPRLYMPVKTAKYLTSASLPIGWADGDMKTGFFRQTITKAIRSWPKWNFFIRGVAREVSTFAFCFNAFFDKYEWRPTLLRMDKGFVPQGTEVMDTEPALFMAKYDYKPSELLELLKNNKEAGRDEWKEGAVVDALNNAAVTPIDSTYAQARSYTDLIRQAVWTTAYAKGYKVISTWHLFAKEATGKVSHYVIMSDQAPNANVTPKGKNEGATRLLYESLDQFDSMEDCVATIVYDYGDGTVHGVWGVGQILYDMSVQVERIRCDSVDNLRMTNKMKLQVPDAKNVNDVKLNVTSDTMIVSGAQFAGNTAAMPQDVQGYELLDQKLSQIAREKIGSFIPPIPLQPSDIKASQINAKVSDQQELREDMLETFLVQLAPLIRTITKRLTDSDSPDKKAKSVLKELKEKLTDEEIELLREDIPVQSIMGFTELAAQKRAAFAASVLGNPLFRQAALARVMAEGSGDETFIQSIVLPDGDQSAKIEAERSQLIENASLALGQPTPILQNDNDWVHMQTLKPSIMAVIKAGNAQIAQIAVQHYAAHWAQGVNKKMIPDDQINTEKSWIASAEKAIEALQQRQQVAQQHQQAGVPMPDPSQQPQQAEMPAQ